MKVQSIAISGCDSAERFHEADGVLDDFGIVDEDRRDLSCEDKDERTHRAHQHHRHPGRYPSGLARVCGIARAKPLPHHRCRRVGKSESGQEREREDSHSDEVRGDFLVAVARDECDVGYESELDHQLLDRRRIADVEDALAESGVRPQPRPSEVQHHPVERQDPKENHAAQHVCDQRRDRGTVDAEIGEAEFSENQNIVEDDRDHIDDAADPQRRARITCAAQSRRALQEHAGERLRDHDNL